MDEIIVKKLTKANNKCLGKRTKTDDPEMYSLNPGRKFAISAIQI